MDFSSMNNNDSNNNNNKTKPKKKKYRHMCVNIYFSIICKNTRLDPIKVFFNRWRLNSDNMKTMEFYEVMRKNEANLCDNIAYGMWNKICWVKKQRKEKWI